MQTWPVKIRKFFVVGNGRLRGQAFNSFLFMMSECWNCLIGKRLTKNGFLKFADMIGVDVNGNESARC